MSFSTHLVSPIDRKIAAFGQKIRLFGLANSARYYLGKGTKAETLCLQAKGVKHPVTFRLAGSDLYHLWAILGRQELSFMPRCVPETIIDAGAHIGLASIFFANRFPNARILALEPSPRNLPLLRANCAPYPQIQVVEGALWPFSTRIAIQNPDDDADSFQVEPASQSAQNTIAAYSPDDLLALLKTPRLGLFKIDIEGAEKELFEVNPRWLERIDNLVIEIHDTLRPGCDSAVASRFPPPHWKRSRRGEYAVFRR